MTNVVKKSGAHTRNVLKSFHLRHFRILAARNSCISASILRKEADEQSCEMAKQQPTVSVSKAVAEITQRVLALTS